MYCHHLESPLRFREVPAVPKDRQTMRLPPLGRACAAKLLLFAVAIVLFAFAAVAARADTPYELQLPRGFPKPNIPEDNPMTWEKVELGRLLFYDTRLSFGDRPKACASCHQQALAFTDGQPHAEGATGQLHPRSAMSLANVAYAGTLAWAHPQLFTLEDQAIIPMINTDPIELGVSGKEDQLLDRLRADTRYQRMFGEAFADQSDPVNINDVLHAIASFERTLLSGNSAYDRYVFGIDDHAISESAKRGEILFSDEKRECFHCHVGFNLTTSNDYQGLLEPQRTFENTALYNLRCEDFSLPQLDLPWCDTLPTPTECAVDDFSRPLGCVCHGTGLQDYGCYPPPNTGAYSVSHQPQDMGKFKPPTLRNVGVTAPYMHDGSIATLEEVIDHYAAGGRTISDGEFAGVGKDSPSKNGSLIRGFTITPQQKADLVEFLKALTDDEFLANPRLSDPFQPVGCPGDCNFDGRIDVDELITAVNVSLGSSSLALCVVSDPSADGDVSIDELLRAINGALSGCQ